jgi:hypothetical protein
MKRLESGQAMHPCASNMSFPLSGRLKRTLRSIIAPSVFLASALHCSVCFSDVGVSEPDWLSPPIVYKVHHRLTLPYAEEVDDIVELGNFTSDGATIMIVLEGNGEHLTGASGDLHRVHNALYVLPAHGEESCTLIIHVDGSRIGIEGIPFENDNSRFCPNDPIWLPVSRQ